MNLSIFQTRVTRLLALLLTALLVGAAAAQDLPAPAGASETVTVGVMDGMNSEPFDVARELTVPPGFGIEVFARVEDARFLGVAPNGDVLVSQPRAGKITLLRPREGQAPESFDLVTGLNMPHDFAFYTLDGTTYLYVAATDEIVRYPYTDGATSLTNGETIVSDLPSEPLQGQDNYRHPLKSLALNGDTLYVMIASSTNADPADLSAEPKRGAIYTYSASTPNQAATSGTLYAEGIRNAEGLAFAPGTENLWAVVNNRDQTAYPAHEDIDGDGNDDYGKVVQSFVDNYPAEEIIQVKQDANYGWPFCNPNPSDGFNDMPFDRDVETNPDGAALDCSSQATQINKGIQAHSAPLGMSFWTSGPAAYENAMTIGLHGSWNRSVLSGNVVALYPYQDGSLGDRTDLVTGWIIDPATQERWGRPVATEPMADGSLLISDDVSGTVYRLYPTSQ